MAGNKIRLLILPENQLSEPDTFWACRERQRPARRERLEASEFYAADEGVRCNRGESLEPAGILRNTTFELKLYNTRRVGVGLRFLWHTHITPHHVVCCVESFPCVTR